MIRVTVTAPFVEETREFPASGRGITTYLRNLKKLQSLHVQDVVSKQVEPKPSKPKYNNHFYRSRYKQQIQEWKQKCEKHITSQGLKIQIRHL